MAPSFSMPVLSLLKVNVLSVTQDGIVLAGNASSIDPSPFRSRPAVSYFHADEDMSCVFVCEGEELFLLQLLIIKNNPKQNKHKKNNCFIKFFINDEIFADTYLYAIFIPTTGDNDNKTALLIYYFLRWSIIVLVFSINIIICKPLLKLAS